MLFFNYIHLFIYSSVDLIRVFFLLLNCSIYRLRRSGKNRLSMAKHVCLICLKFDFRKVTIGDSDTENIERFSSIHHDHFWPALIISRNWILVASSSFNNSKGTCTQKHTFTHMSWIMSIKLVKFCYITKPQNKLTSVGRTDARFLSLSLSFGPFI